MSPTPGRPAIGVSRHTVTLTTEDAVTLHEIAPSLSRAIRHVVAYYRERQVPVSSAPLYFESTDHVGDPGTQPAVVLHVKAASNLLKCAIPAAVLCVKATSIWPAVNMPGTLLSVSNSGSFGIGSGVIASPEIPGI